MSLSQARVGFAQGFAGTAQRSAGHSRQPPFDRPWRESDLITPGSGRDAEAWSRAIAADRAAGELGRLDAAIDSADAGRLIALADMREWAQSLGSDNVLPLPRARRWCDRIAPAGGICLTDEAAQSLGQIEWFYSQPGAGAGEVASRRVRAILNAMSRLSMSPDFGLPGPVPGTRETACQNYRIIYCALARDDAENIVVLDICGQAHL
jgi:hypothetical protein